MDFSPPIKDRSDLELIAIAHSTPDFWQQDAIDQAKDELSKRGVSHDYQQTVLKEWEEAANLEEIKYKEQLRLNAFEKYKLSEMIKVFLLSPLILTGKIYSDSMLTLTELHKENFRIIFKQRLILLITGFLTWIAIFYLFIALMLRIQSKQIERADIREWERNRTTYDSTKSIK
jgi:hypothetical protein